MQNVVSSFISVLPIQVELIYSSTTKPRRLEQTNEFG